MNEQTLLAAVEAAFAETAAATPGWPDPHPGAASPPEEEYSRCLDPGKYRILAARAAAWTRALTELGLATVEPLEPADAPAAWLEGLPYDVSPTRAHWLRPHRRGAQPLLISYRGFDGCDDNIVAVSAGQPAVLLASLPSCGCDACDDGSGPQLDLLDAALVDVVNGQVVHVATPHGEVIGHENGWEAHGLGSPEEVEQVLDDARADRSPHRVTRGRPWW
ncbi:hypothetical protein GTR02_00365 [Kineococcus sp. R8]|uniref:DUF6226 family protein n=1 Tax=Kineococcus siccus TaxID=2696567 RepID=UPI001412012B|nr:hypothetical protein [Kineococcus siccus]